MSCYACMGDVPGSDVWTKGVTTSVGDDSNALLGSNVGAALFNSAVGALNKYWVLSPRGSETAAQLRNRIAMVFAERVASSWSGDISVDAVNASPAFAAIVADVSLTSRQKTPAELAADRNKKLLWIGVGVLALGLIGLLYFRGRGTASGAAASAPGSSALPDATII